MFQVVDIGVDPTKQEHNSFSQIKITLKSAVSLKQGLRNLVVMETVGFTVALKKIARLGDFRVDLLFFFFFRLCRNLAEHLSR